MLQIYEMILGLHIYRTVFRSGRAKGRKHDSCISGQHPENRDKGDRGDYNIRKDKDSWKRPT